MDESGTDTHVVVTTSTDEEVVKNIEEAHREGAGTANSIEAYVFADNIEKAADKQGINLGETGMIAQAALHESTHRRMKTKGLKYDRKDAVSGKRSHIKYKFAKSGSNLRSIMYPNQHLYSSSKERFVFHKMTIEILKKTQSK